LKVRGEKATAVGIYLFIEGEKSFICGTPVTS